MPKWIVDYCYPIHHTERYEIEAETREDAEAAFWADEADELKPVSRWEKDGDAHCDVYQMPTPDSNE